MRLDVLIPTLNRAALLEKTLDSLLTAPRPEALSVTITIIDNRCTDGTAAMVRRKMLDHPGRVRLIHERRRGKSRALNAGIAATDGDLVGMVDDDEVVAPQWLQVVYRAFQDPALDFAGGPYHAVWTSPPPAWVPQEYLAVLGAADSGPDEVEYSREFPGILKGGNAVIRRRVLEQVGPFAEYLGPGGYARLLSCEDEDMYYRLLKHGARGRYLPDMVIHHHVSTDRLTPEYYRRWCFWRGVSRGLMDRAHPMNVTYFAGVPRFLQGRAARGLLRLASARAAGVPKEHRLRHELPFWDLAGYAWGRHVYPLARFFPTKNRRTSREDRRRR